MTDSSNPYQPYEPVADPAMLFGRQDVMDWLERQINNQARSLVIKGLPLIGKTSLIRHVSFGDASPLADSYKIIVTLYTPQAAQPTGRNRPAESKIDNVLQPCLEQIATQLQLLGLISAPQLDFTRQPTTLLRDLLAQAQERLGQTRLIIYFDDLHLLLSDDMSLIASFLSMLRPTLDDCPQLHFVFTLNSDQLRYIRHPLIDRVPSVTVGPLAADTAINLITLPVRTVLRFDYGVTRRIAEINSNHPYYLTLFCHALLNRQMYDGWVNQQDFEVVLDDLLTTPIEPFNQVWNGANWAERGVLAGMATIQGKHGPVTSQEITRFLQKYHAAVSVLGVETALESLAERGVLVPMGHISYRLQVELFRFWLRKHADLKQTLERANWNVRR